MPDNPVPYNDPTQQPTTRMQEPKCNNDSQQPARRNEQEQKNAVILSSP